MFDNEEEWPPRCPECGSSKVDYERQSEYTGGGYADYWYECICQECGYSWRTDEKTSYS